jgi:hypothetical protein
MGPSGYLIHVDVFLVKQDAVTPHFPQYNAQQTLYQNLLVILFLISLNGSLRNTVQISLSTLGDASSSLILILLQDTDLLKGLHDFAVDATGGIDVVGWARTTVAGAAVDFAETANTDGFAEVDVAGDGGGADVEPINGLRGELLGWAGLDGINPTCERC